eukprot:6315440-Pyramimonas_sp.AAC.1
MSSHYIAGSVHVIAGIRHAGHCRGLRKGLCRVSHGVFAWSLQGRFAGHCMVSAGGAQGSDRERDLIRRNSEPPRPLHALQGLWVRPSMLDLR